MNEHNNKFKKGDVVRVKDNFVVMSARGRTFMIDEIDENFIVTFYSAHDFEYRVSEGCLELAMEFGNIQITNDPANPRTVVAKNLITGETAEAKCSPKDDFDFNVGAKLALERLAKHDEKKEESKPKTYFSGKVVCVESSERSHYTPGKVYTLNECGKLNDDTTLPWTHVFVYSIDELNRAFAKESHDYFASDNYAKFIEYKGE